MSHFPCPLPSRTALAPCCTLCSSGLAAADDTVPTASRQFAPADEVIRPAPVRKNPNDEIGEPPPAPVGSDERIRTPPRAIERTQRPVTLTDDPPGTDNIPPLGRQLEHHSFDDMDADADGYIDSQDRQKTETMSKLHFNQIDSNADGRVSRREYETWVQRRQEARELDATP